MMRKIPIILLFFCFILMIRFVYAEPLEKPLLIDVTEHVSVEKFHMMKKFILQYGDRQTFCNMYNQNPHYSLGDMEIYLLPAVGQRNINCDPWASDFNVIVIRSFSNRIQYMDLVCYMERDALTNEPVYSDPRMQKGHTYLIHYTAGVTQEDKLLLIGDLLEYVMQMDEEMERKQKKSPLDCLRQ